ncbi:MAG TPA: TerD family protein [Kineosporiaceae bacterium]|nr:TerD family protein [Kineosporiaceae bacterium]
MTVLTGLGPLPSQIAQRYPFGYAVVDVETSGLSAAADRVLQLAVMQLNSRGGLEDSWTTLLDPGCDPGPVHLHGLTRARLAGSPRYDMVAQQVSRMLAGRVLVAHNASFDWQFLSAEAARAGQPLAVAGRLCTLALTRRLDVPVASLSLASVAQYWGVTQGRAHAADDDTRVAVEVLRHSLVAAARLGLLLPIVLASETGTARAGYPAKAPRPVCPWRHPGRLIPSSPLVQGMTVVITGPTAEARETLMRRATEAGLDVMNSVSRRTSLLVTNNPKSATRKVEAALAHQTPTLSENDFRNLLTRVAPGTPRTMTASPALRPVVAPSASKAGLATVTTGRLRGRRVLILGGPHERAAEVRARVAELGGQPAVNLSASVSDVVALLGADLDPRWSRATAIELNWLDEHELMPVPRPVLAVLAAPSAAVATSRVAPIAVSSAVVDPVVLSRGAVTDLPADDEWWLSVQWGDPEDKVEAVDVVAFVVDADEQVGEDSDFCFYNNLTHPSGAVDLALETPGEALLQARLNLLPEGRGRIVVAAALEGDATFGDVGPIELVLRTAAGTPVVRATLDAATDETTLVLATIYNRNGAWRLRAVGQGYESGLTSLAVLHGVDVDD